MKITGRHLVVTAALTRHVRERCSRLLKYGVSMERIEIVLSVNKLQHMAEAICSVGKRRFQAKTSTREMYMTIDQLVDRLESQIRKQKDKRTAHKGTGPKGSQPLVRREMDHPPMEVVRPKLSVLSREAAKEQLDVRPGSLVVFTSADSGKLQILQRGENGQIVLIDP